MSDSPERTKPSSSLSRLLTRSPVLNKNNRNNSLLSSPDGQSSLASSQLGSANATGASYDEIHGPLTPTSPHSRFIHRAWNRIKRKMSVADVSQSSWSGDQDDQNQAPEFTDSSRVGPDPEDPSLQTGDLPAGTFDDDLTVPSVPATARSETWPVSAPGYSVPRNSLEFNREPSQANQREMGRGIPRQTTSQNRESTVLGMNMLPKIFTGKNRDTTGASGSGDDDGDLTPRDRRSIAGSEDGDVTPRRRSASFLAEPERPGSGYSSDVHSDVIKFFEGLDVPAGQTLSSPLGVNRHRRMTSDGSDTLPDPAMMAQLKPEKGELRAATNFVDPDPVRPFVPMRKPST